MLVKKHNTNKEAGNKGEKKCVKIIMILFRLFRSVVLKLANKRIKNNNDDDDDK